MTTVTGPGDDDGGSRTSCPRGGGVGGAGAAARGRGDDSDDSGGGGGGAVGDGGGSARCQRTRCRHHCSPWQPPVAASVPPRRHRSTGRRTRPATPSPRSRSFFMSGTVAAARTVVASRAVAATSPTPTVVVFLPLSPLSQSVVRPTPIRR